MAALDEYEGVADGCYSRELVDIETADGEQLQAEVYIGGERFTVLEGRPSDWYLQIILAGAKEHGLPEAYIEGIARLARGQIIQGAQPMNEQIKDLLQTYQRALNEANLDLVRSVFAADAIVIGQPFPTATGIEAIAALYADFLSKLDFNVQFDLLEMELSGDLGFIRTHSRGTIVPKGKKPEGSEGNREIFIVKKIAGAWKFYRYIFNAEVPG